MHTKTKATILFITNSPPYSRGSHSVSQELAGHLRDCGFNTITVSHRATRWQRFLEMLTTIWWQRREYQVAHVQVFSGLAFVWAEVTCALLGLLGKPFLLTLHGGNLPPFAQRWPRRVTRLLNSAAVVTTPSRYLFEAMQQYCVKLQVLPNAIATQFYPFRQRSAVTPKLIWLRALHEIYNPTLAVETLAQLLTEFPAAQLTMYGPDKADGSRERVLMAAQQLRVSGQIEIAGAIPKAEVPLHISRGDIFLNTTNIDNTPSSVIEALACGLCVVSTNVGGIPYLLEHEQNALLVPPNDALAMTQAIRRLLHDPALAARLSANGRRKIEQFDWNYVLPRWEKLFNETLALTQRRDAGTAPSPNLS
jgi:glycosyltransferase involved in cell wall biosynthesis